MSQITPNQVGQQVDTSSTHPQGMVGKAVYKLAGVDRAERIVNAAGRSVGANDCQGPDPSHSHETLKDSIVNAIPGPKFIKKHAFGPSDADKMNHPTQ